MRGEKTISDDLFLSGKGRGKYLDILTIYKVHDGKGYMLAIRFLLLPYIMRGRRSRFFGRVSHCRYLLPGQSLSRWPVSTCYLDRNKNGNVWSH